MDRRPLARVALAACASLAFGAPLQADTLSRGHDVAAQFLRGDADAIWAAMTPDMRQAIGSPQALRAVHDDLRQAFGDEAEVLSETESAQGGFDVYTRLARWTQSAAPIGMTVSFDAQDKVAGLFVGPRAQAAPSQHLDYRTQARLRLPVDGEWFVYWGGRDVADNYHAADPGQRFALDLLVLEDGASHTGDAGVLANYHCWHRPILAPADATVVAVVKDLPDQAIGAMDPRHPAGNHVVLDFGHEEFGFLAHLRQGSATVAPGDRVTAGQELGRCGNSGNSSEPHLHFHLQNTARLGLGAGLPAQFIDYRADGKAVARGEPQRGERVEAGR